MQCSAVCLGLVLFLSPAQSAGQAWLVANGGTLLSPRRGCAWCALCASCARCAGAVWQSCADAWLHSAGAGLTSRVSFADVTVLLNEDYKISMHSKDMNVFTCVWILSRETLSTWLHKHSDRIYVLLFLFQTPWSARRDNPSITSPSNSSTPSQSNQVSSVHRFIRDTRPLKPKST